MPTETRESKMVFVGPWKVRSRRFRKSGPPRSWPFKSQASEGFVDVFVDKDRALPTFLLVREFIKHILIESKVLSKCAFCAVRTSQMIRVSLK